MIRAMPAPRRYDKITPGPARRIVTLLPRNRPTPIAPPMAIMVSCLWPRRRCRPSASCAGCLPAADAAIEERDGSVMGLGYGCQSTLKFVHFFHGVVVHQ